MNKNKKILIVVTIVFLSFFALTTLNSINDSENLEKELISKIQNKFNNNSNLKLIETMPVQEIKIDKDVLDRVKKIVRNTCTADTDEEEDLPKNDVLFDLKYGQINCDKINKYKIEKDYNFENTKKINKLIVDYKQAIDSLEYPADNAQEFTRIFKDNAHYLHSLKDYKYYPMVTYILGDSAIRSNNEELYMVGPLILTSLILEYENNSDFTKFAWIRLNEEIHLGYSGSIGDETPKSWDKLLTSLAYLTAMN